MWEPPQITISPGVSSSLAQLVKAHQGVVCSTESNATHIIMPSASFTDDTDDYYRPLLVKGKCMTVHWWFYPEVKGLV